MFWTLVTTSRAYQSRKIPNTGSFFFFSSIFFYYCSGKGWRGLPAPATGAKVGAFRGRKDPAIIHGPCIVPSPPTRPMFLTALAHTALALPPAKNKTKNRHKTNVSARNVVSCIRHNCICLPKQWEEFSGACRCGERGTVCNVHELYRYDAHVVCPAQSAYISVLG